MLIRSVIVAVLAMGTVTFTAGCGDSESPSPATGSVFGTTAPVDNSVVNGNDSPVETNEVPAEQTPVTDAP